MKLHLGCGKRNFGEDWIHIDGGDFKHLHSHDIINLPFENESADLIYASHVIEYFDREEVKIVLAGWRRVLKKGGILRLAVPNFCTMARLYMEADYDLDSFLGPLYGRMKMGDAYIYHKTVYDYYSLENLLNKCQFSNVRLWSWKKVDHGKIDDHSQAYLPHMDKDNGILISLNLEADK